MLYQVYAKRTMSRTKVFAWIKEFHDRRHPR